MAGRGNRDLKVSFLTDLDRFETDPAARGLEDVADAAKDAGRALDARPRHRCRPDTGA